MNSSILPKILPVFILHLFFSLSIYSQWIPIGPPGGRVSAVHAFNSRVAAGTLNCGVFFSSNNGQSWNITSLRYNYVYSVLVNNSSLFAGVWGKGLFLSTDNGQTWQLVLNRGAYALCQSGSFIVAGVAQYGLYLSSNNGLNWVQTSLNNQDIGAVVMNGSYIFAGKKYGSVGVLNISSNYGQNWTQSSLPNMIQSVTVSGTYIIVGTSSGIYRSSDNGNTWSTVILNNKEIWSLTANGSYVFAGTRDFGVYMSTDNGANWIQTSINNQAINSLTAQGSNIFAGTDNIGVYYSSNIGSNWSQSQFYGHWVTSLNYVGLNLYVGTQNYPATSGLFLTSDNGSNWLLTSLNQVNINCLSRNNTYFFAGTSFGLYRSSNNGIDWMHIPLTNYNVNAIAVNGPNVFIIVDYLYHSNDNGLNWIQDSLYVNTLAISDSFVLAGSYYGLLISTNNGSNWSLTSLSNQSIRALAIKNSTIFVGTYGNGILISTNRGQNWSQSSLNNQIVNSIVINDSNVYAGTDTSGVFISNNNGLNWTRKNEGFGNINVRALLIANNYLYVGTLGASAWKRPLGELVGVENINNSVPKSFSLYQNYPNPFNPTTKIKFDIPNLSPPFTGHPLGQGGQGGLVKLIIYNIIGQEIKTLVNEQLKPGSYEIEWNAANYPSGVYFYRLQTGIYSNTKKLVLLK